MDPRRRRKECVDDRERSNRSQTAPLICDGGIDRQHAIAVQPRHVEEPAIEDLRLACISALQVLDSLSYLPDCHDAQEQGVGCLRFEPCRQPCLRPRGSAEVGDDIGVEQKAHKSTRRPRSFDRRSRSCGARGIALRKALKSRLSGGTSAASRMARCSASAERPCAAARSRSAFTSRWSRRRTSSCRMPSMIARPVAETGRLPATSHVRQGRPLPSLQSPDNSRIVTRQFPSTTKRHRCSSDKASPRPAGSSPGSRRRRSFRPSPRSIDNLLSVVKSR